MKLLNSLSNNYFDWMCSLISDKEHDSSDYYKLLSYLNDIEFTYIIPMDENRAIDGVDFRYRFAYENHFSREFIDRYLSNRPCSVLEMMVSLAFACEENIMDDPKFGNRTGKWFWGMIDNLGLGKMTDDVFDVKRVDKVITKFLDRKYQSNGKGGLFTLKHCRYDLREVDIWYQMMWYLVENFDFSV